MRPCKLQPGDKLRVRPTMYGAGTADTPAMTGTVTYIHPLHRFVVLEFPQVQFREAFLISPSGGLME